MTCRGMYKVFSPIYKKIRFRTLYIDYSEINQWPQFFDNRDSLQYTKDLTFSMASLTYDVTSKNSIRCQITTSPYLNLIIEIMKNMTNLEKLVFRMGQCEVYLPVLKQIIDVIPLEKLRDLTIDVWDGWHGVSKSSRHGYFDLRWVIFDRCHM